MAVNRKLRYAVAGLGHIAQVAVLPAFKHAAELCELTAFISSDEEKVSKLKQEYGVEHCWSYDQFDEALKSGTFDAIYIALPNDMHKEFTVGAATAGIHVLCEKPMAMTSAECVEMIEAADANGTKLMIAYRLQFEKCNMTAVELIKQGKIGTPRVFNSSFTLQVKDNNIRITSEHGGGPLSDIGIYCVNAARYLFQEEPTEVVAMSAKSQDPRFREIEESLTAIMRFPGAKLASFVCSFGAASFGRYEVIGTEGSIALDPAYEYAQPLEYILKMKGKEDREKSQKCDQFAPELLHFAECILENKEPRPSGREGLNDVLVMEAIRKSADTGRTVSVEQHARASKPGVELIEEKPGVRKPHLVKVESASE